MGIDIYMRWDGMTEDEKDAQYTGFRTDAGHVGYLREAYHGEPYATYILVDEAFASGEVEIPAHVLRERLLPAMQAAVERAKVLYKEERPEESPAVKAFVDFVELAERKERETGKPVRVIASY